MFPISLARSTAAPAVRPELTTISHLRLVVDAGSLEDEADARAGREALAEWEADNRRTVPFAEARAQAEARDAEAR